MSYPYSRFLTITAAALAITGNLFAQFGSIHLPGSKPAKPDTENAGNSKDVISIVRDLPPAINLENTRISFEANAVAGVPGPLLQILKTRLVTSLQGDKRFIIDEKNPATVIKLTATTVEIKQSPTTFGTMQITQLKGTLRVSFQAIDAVKKNPLDSTNMESGFEKQYHTGPVQKILGVQMPLDKVPSNDEVMNALVDDISAKVTRRVARTKGTVEFRLPGGELRAYQDKMRHKEWVSLYDDLTVMKEPALPEERAARLYWMGISKEAAAYEIKDSNDARKSLLDADQHYKDAAALQTKDAGDYANGSRRTEEAIVLLAGASPNAAPDTSGPKSVDAEVLNNDAIIKMVKGGVNARLVIAQIKAAEQTGFDLSSSGMVQLSEAKVPDEIVLEMMNKSKKK